MIAGEGMQFESHLWHSIPLRQRGFCFWRALVGPKMTWTLSTFVYTVMP
jgi:hypothetical protein